jgi:AraC-like DNA-binding protein
MTNDTNHASGELALMQAVLADAVRCLQGAAGPARHRARLAAEAKAWIEVRNARWAFSFENVCQQLGIDPETIRRRLLAVAACGPAAAPEASAPRRACRAQPTDEIAAMIRAGKPLRIVAEHFGISIAQASALSNGLASRLKAERDEEILRLRRDGWTYPALAARFGLSRIRVKRICRRALRSGGPAGRPQTPLVAAEETGLAVSAVG